MQTGPACTASFVYRRSRALEHCQQMLCAATAGLEGYCPVCLLPCGPFRHAACQHHALPASDSGQARLQHARRGQQSSNHHSSNHVREQQQHQQHCGLPQCKVEQSLGSLRRSQLAAADGTAGSAALCSQRQTGRGVAQGNAAGSTQSADALQQQQHMGTLNGHADAAEASQAATEAWVSHLPSASHFVLLCVACGSRQCIA